MSEGRIIDKEMVSRAVIKKIRVDLNPETIKAKHIKDYDNPRAILQKGSKKGYRPDIITVKRDEINIFEIELDDKMPVEKWKLFSSYASKNNGNLFLVVPENLKEIIKKEIKSNLIASRLIYFEAN